MSYVVLTEKERNELCDLYFRLKRLGERFPSAREEAMAALRCLKAVHSNAIEDSTVDRIFLQLMLHGTGVGDKGRISRHYENASTELRGQEALLRSLEAQARQREPLSLTMVREMHRQIFAESMPDMAGRFRTGEVRISQMNHRPPPPQRIAEALQQHIDGINEDLWRLVVDSKEAFLDVLRLSARVHYLVASVHPFEDGNGRVARAAGDYVMLVHGFYYDVIMTDYRNIYLDALDASTWANTAPLFHFLEYSYQETLKRISGFFSLTGKDGAE